MATTQRRGATSVLDHYLPHFDAVVRDRVILPVDPAQAYAWLERFDFAQLCASVGRAIEDMRAVPPLVAGVAHRAGQLPASARFILDDAAGAGFIPLAEKPGRHLVLGAVGKLWKPRIELLRLDREEFAAFRDAKYVKLLVGILVLPYGTTRTLLKHEARFLATDDSARTHFRRAWRVAEPFVGFFLRRAMKALKAVAQEQRAEAAIPPWRGS
jgi:hypothetical protein